MFSKVNLKHILILAIGFFTCSSIYLTESTILANVTSAEFANRIAVLFANFSMALGIFIFIKIYKHTKNIKKHYLVWMLLTLISLLTFFSTNNHVIMGICLCLSCFFGTSSFCLGYHLSLITQNIEKNYRGRVFAIGYASASFASYLLMLLPFNIYNSIYSLLMYVPLILLNIWLIISTKELKTIEKESYSFEFKKSFLVLSVIIILMSFLSIISTDTISISYFDIEGIYYYSRLYYGIGLIVAGIICDKNKELFDILTLSCFVFYLITLVLINQGISTGAVVALSYFLLGFFVVFRTITFMNLASKSKSLIYVCSYGVMYHILIEGIIAVFEDNLLNHYLLLIMLEALVLGVLVWIFVLFYMKNTRVNENDKIKEVSLKYNLSIQEEKVLYLLVQDLSNQEIADKLFLSINTIRNHVASIYKKTGMKKKELREKCYFRTN